jgi:hypothetical protein
LRDVIVLAPSLIGLVMVVGTPFLMTWQRDRADAAMDPDWAVRAKLRDLENSAELRMKAFHQRREEIAEESIRLSLRIAEIEEIRKGRKLSAEEAAALSAEEKAALEKLSDLQKRLMEIDSSLAELDAGRVR